MWARETTVRSSRRSSETIDLGGLLKKWTPRIQPSTCFGFSWGRMKFWITLRKIWRGRVILSIVSFMWIKWRKRRKRKRHRLRLAPSRNLEAKAWLKRISNQVVSWPCQREAHQEAKESATKRDLLFLKLYLTWEKMWKTKLRCKAKVRRKKHSPIPKCGPFTTTTARFSRIVR